jgi:ribose 5-phosphate isomerase RpiB
MRIEALADAESVEVAWDLVQTFLAAKFTHAQRHVRRLSKVAELELHATRTDR